MGDVKSVVKKLRGCGNRLVGDDFETARIKNSGVSGKTFDLNNNKIVAGTKLDRIRNNHGAVLVAGLDLTIPDFNAVGDIKKPKKGQAVAIEQSHVGFKMDFCETGEVGGVEIKFGAGQIGPAIRQ